MFSYAHLHQKQLKTETQLFVPNWCMSLVRVLKQGVLVSMRFEIVFTNKVSLKNKSAPLKQFDFCLLLKTLFKSKIITVWGVDYKDNSVHRP